MLDLNSATHYWIFPEPADMRKGKAKLASLIRDRLETDPLIGKPFTFRKASYIGKR